MKVRFEVTDTFGGESNYSWVRRESRADDGASDTAWVRRAKKFAGFTGVRCRVESYGGTIAIFPAGICQVCFITWEE